MPVAVCRLLFTTLYLSRPCGLHSPQDGYKILNPLSNAFLPKAKVKVFIIVIYAKYYVLSTERLKEWKGIDNNASGYDHSRDPSWNLRFCTAIAAPQWVRRAR